jgi:hypothetical protein
MVSATTSSLCSHAAGSSSLHHHSAAPERPTATSSEHCRVESALLFWLNAAIDSTSSSSPAPPTDNDAVTHVTAPSTASDVMMQAFAADTATVTAKAAVSGPSHSNEVRQESSSSAPPTRSLLKGSPKAAKGTTPSTAVSSASLDSPPRLRIHDVMPLFDALLAGHLGPVAIDVQLQGNVRLVQHPRQFEATLKSYEAESTGPLKAALSAVQPFLLLCHRAAGVNSEGERSDTHRGSSDGLLQPGSGEEVTIKDATVSPSSAFPSTLPTQPALYTMEPTNHYPVLPLLAQLLRSPSVTKVVLHSRLLYRLLFLFLGTDRVEIQRVVDVTTWSELGRQLRPVLTATYPIPVDGVVELADVQAVLPAEVRQRLADESRRIMQQQQQQMPSLQRSFKAERNGDVRGGVVRLVKGSSEEDTVTSSYTGSSNSSGDSERDGESADDDIVSTALTSSDAPEKNDSDEESQQDAVELLHTIVPIDHQSLSTALRKGGVRHRKRRRHDARFRGEGHIERGRDLRLRDSSPVAAVTTSVYDGLRSLALFYTEVLHSFFDNVTGVAKPTSHDVASASVSHPALRTSLSPSEWGAQRTYAEFLCELMTYHGVFVDDVMFHGMSTLLDVQLQAIEDLAGRVVLTLLERIGGSSQQGGTVASTPSMSPSTCMSAEYFRQCIEQGPGAPLLATHPKLDTSLLRALATEATLRDAEEATLLRLSCQLVCIWIAFHERTEAKQRIKDMFSNVADRLRVRVLEQRRGAVDGRRAPPAKCEISFSVHPTWSLHNSSTGRVFSMLPNVQNLNKQPLRTTFAVNALHPTPPEQNGDGGAAPPRPCGTVDLPTPDDVERWVQLASTDAQNSTLLFPEQPQWTQRHLYRAPPGCVLLSFDFNQLELRVLAQLSGDATLRQHLSSDVDVLTLTTASVLQLPAADLVQQHQRQAMKVIVYGLLYGMGQRTMEERIRKMQREPTDQATPRVQGSEDRRSGGGDESSAVGERVPLTAAQLIARFYQVYPRVASYLRETRQDGLHRLSVETLSGRKSLAAVTDANRRKQRAMAQAIQGGAADVVLCGMQAVHQQRHSLTPCLPAAPLALIMAIHDELIYAVPRAATDTVARSVKSILEGQASALRLAVPLPVSVRVGTSFGSLEEYHFPP